ncbi:peptidase M22, glycoprotease [Heliocybe sulcata]|uniref:N(6)-L-threonylcarbamoyladenine synthase n=1 Tax=Heliocybe sulcata TaxID=5364 RepID=A0A5C3N9V4_9AGAM|nr:peptidase M22, glycoprotease [Heliocybe sulcata]
MLSRAALRCARGNVLHLKSNSYARNFAVLALESSADDTCAAVVTSEREILSNVVISQNELHASVGGINPYVAIQGHQKNMPVALRRALDEAKLEMGQVDGIAFTRGPGIGGCLSVSSNAAKNMAAALRKPLVGVHHMQAHALTPLLTSPKESLPQFPFLTLLVSGGHTMIVLAKSVKSFQILATTVDESIGRAFDKVARMLGLEWGTKGYGAALEAFCASGMEKFGELSPQDLLRMPSPMPGVLGFSYSGPHSNIERHVHSQGGIEYLDEKARWRLAVSFQKAAVSQLEEKVELGLKWCYRNNLPVKDLVVSGGVASNQYLQKRLHERLCSDNAEYSSMQLSFPPLHLCRDNAAMIAWASMHRFLVKDLDDYSIEHRAKWSIEDL